MSKLTLIFYIVTFLTIVLFLVFSYLMTTVNPERIQNDASASKDPAVTMTNITFYIHDDDTIVNDERRAEDYAAAEWVDVERNVEKSNQDRTMKTLDEARTAGETVRIEKSVLPVPGCSSSSTRSTRAILVNATLESNLTIINGTSSSKSSKGRRSIKEQRKKKQGIVVMRVMGDEGKPRIEVILYPKRLKGKSNKSHDYKRNKFGGDLKYQGLEIQNSILHIFPDDTAIFENGDYSYTKDVELDNIQYAETSESAKTTENIFGLKSLWINPINTSTNSHAVTKLITYFLPTISNVMQNSSKELTLDADNVQIMMNYSEKVKLKSESITAEQTQWSVTKLSTLLLPTTSSVPTNALSGSTVAISNTQIEINNSEQIKSDIIVEQMSRPMTLLNRLLLTTAATPIVMNTSIEVTPVINNTQINMDQSAELKATSDVTVDQTEESTTNLNVILLVSAITENASGGTFAIANTQNETGDKETIEIESNQIVEVGAQSILDSITSKSDIVSWGETNIMADRTSNKNATYDSEIELTSTLPRHTNETVEMSGAFPESNETFTSESTTENSQSLSNTLQIDDVPRNISSDFNGTDES